MSPPSASGRNARSASRELSPYSARRNLTLGLNNNNGNNHNEHPRKRESTHRKSRSRSRSRNRNTKPDVQLGQLPDRRPRSISKDASPMQIDPAPKNERKASPEPYRKPREQSRDRKTDRSTDQRRERSRDKRRDTSRERRRDGSQERRRDRSRDRRQDAPRDKRREGSRERRKDRPRDGSMDQSREGRRHRNRSREPRRDESKDRRRNRSRERRRDRDRSRDKKPSHSKDRHRHHSRSRSRSPKRRRRHQRSPSPKPHARSSKPLPSQEVSFRGLDNSAQPPTTHGGAPATLKPNFSTTGLLAQEANTVAGTKTVLKYHEPPEARKPSPSHPWTLFIFSGADTIAKIDLFTQSCWMFGRAREVADVPLEHASASSQHAAIQFRYVSKVVEDAEGVRKERGKVRPYVIDLESVNGTDLNGEAIEGGRYVELRDGDVLKFGACEREYVVLCPKE